MNLKVRRINYPEKRLPADVNRLCRATGCGLNAQAHCLCQAHYMRLRRGKCIDAPLRKAPDYIGWLKEHANWSSDKCLIWPFGTKENGYGRLYIGKKCKPAHREMCRISHGEPKGVRRHCAHSCGNPSCVNPRHLRWATPKENMADKVAHGTNNNGAKHGLAKLTEKDVAEIRESTLKGSELAQHFQVSQSTISEVRNGKRWCHV